MKMYKVFFREKNHEFCGGQNQINSKEYQLWINQRATKDGQKFKEFAYSVGSVNNKTAKETIRTRTWPDSLDEGVRRLVALVKNNRV